MFFFCFSECWQRNNEDYYLEWLNIKLCMNMHAGFSIIKTKKNCVLEWRKVAAPSLEMPLNAAGNAIQPPLHHRGGSPALPLMHGAPLFSLP